jgi:hypothetical protein
VLADVIAVVLVLVGAVSEVDTALGAGVAAVTRAGSACAVDVAEEVVGSVTGAGTMTGGYFLGQ